VILNTLKKQILNNVEKPGQYLGLEWGSYKKDWQKAKSRMAIVYPDLYELGMSNFGIKILYNIVNQHPDFLCDRAYSVMPDMEAQMQKHNLPLWGWESYQPLSCFDFLGFSLAYELCYTNVLTVLDLSKIQFQAQNRTHKDALVFAGGPAVFNPEPMANYFDFFIIGDGEELIVEVQEKLIAVKNDFLEANPNIKQEIIALGTTAELAYRELKNFPLDLAESKKLREKYLLALSELQGIYVPSLYEPDPQENFLAKPKFENLQFPVTKRITQFLEDFNQPVSGPVPLIKTVQDKQVLEIRRGCDRGCRFCQVGYTYLPVRERSPEDLYRRAADSIEQSGYEDLTLLSLSASDYTCLTEVAKAINNEHAQDGISLNMPSQRADRFNVDLADEISQARKSGMTFAPEAGSEKMRKIINKGLSQEEIYKAIKGTYAKGWNHIKLYFMVGLPFEDDTDLDAILDILSWSINMAKELKKENPAKFRKELQVTCTISTFVPKTFTAFQWFSQTSRDEFARKHKYLNDALVTRKLQRNVKLNCTEPELALIEAVLSRADRRWGDVIESVWRAGSRMDSWSEFFNLARWQDAAKLHGFDLDDEATRHREPGSKQAWDVLSIGFTEKFLLHEWQQAVNVAETIPCTENKCHACGVCFNLDVKNIVAENLSKNNPFVTEIDKAKRKQSCANFDELYSTDIKQKDLIAGKSFEVTEQKERKSFEPIIVVRHTQAQQKLRLKVSKLNNLKYIGHLDFQKVFERALRRTALPVVHTTGFNQRIKITWGLALPLFFESEAEYLEIELAEKFNLQELKETINQHLLADVQILEIVDITNEKPPAINNLLKADYQIDLDQEISQAMIDDFLSQEKIEIEKLGKVKGKRKQLKVVDLKPRIIEIKLLSNTQVAMTLEKSQRPDEILKSLLSKSSDFSARIKRTKQVFEKAILV
jgi:radical SAM-linked protein